MAAPFKKPLTIDHLNLLPAGTPVFSRLRQPPSLPKTKAGTDARAHARTYPSHVSNYSNALAISCPAHTPCLLFPRSSPKTKLETAMANRRARPSLLLPAWRAVGFVVGSGATALLPAEASARVGAAIGRAVQEQYDANIRTMYEARIEEEESEVSERLQQKRVSTGP